MKLLVHKCTLAEAAFGRDKDNQKPLDHCKKGCVAFPKIKELLEEAELSLDYSDEYVYRMQLISEDGRIIGSPCSYERMGELSQVV